MHPNTPQYAERLTAPRAWWALVAIAGLTSGLIVMPLGVLAMLIGLVVGAAAGAAGLSTYGSAQIRVVGDALVAGDARIPLSALGAAEPLDAEETVAWRSHKADPRAFMLLRSYIPTAVRVEVTDPADPTPYVYLSTRDPERLAAALSPVREG
ncbi:DUF3093 domain-containing protein [Streptomyces albidoflavus]